MSGKQPSAVNTGRGEKKNEKKEDFNFILPFNIFILGPLISCLFEFGFFKDCKMIFILSSHIYSPQPNSVDRPS